MTRPAVGQPAGGLPGGGNSPNSTPLRPLWRNARSPVHFRGNEPRGIYADDGLTSVNQGSAYVFTGFLSARSQEAQLIASEGGAILSGGNVSSAGGGLNLSAKGNITLNAPLLSNGGAVSLKEDAGIFTPPSEQLMLH